MTINHEVTAREVLLETLYRGTFTLGSLALASGVAYTTARATLAEMLARGEVTEYELTIYDPMTRSKMRAYTATQPTQRLCWIC